MTPRNPFSGLANRIRLESEVLEKFGELYASDPEASIELLQRMAKEAGVGVQTAQPRVTIADRLREYFLSIGNDWRSLDDLVEATEIGKNSLRQVVYKQAPDEFEKRQSPEGGRKVEWRLADHEHDHQQHVEERHKDMDGGAEGGE